MSIAAVPNYLRQDFSTASPGLRFGMYLNLWEGVGWTKNKEKPLANATGLNENDKRTMVKLLARQQQAFDTVAATEAAFRLDALATAPFTTGLGNEHPLENGFAFLNPYGLPYLPGSGIKGVLRQAARELASGQWGEAHGWSEDRCYTLMQGEGEKRKPVLDESRRPLQLSMLDVLFGRESGDGDTQHVRGALGFWDVIPQIKGERLHVEVMTPHQGHYYQQKQDRNAGDSTTPHDSGQPIPINFLTVPQGSEFTFHVLCDLPHLVRLAPALAEIDPDDEQQRPRWKILLIAAFELAFAWLGFGAKTAVGYGAMQRDNEKDAERQRERERAEHAARLASLSPAMQFVEGFVEHMQTRHQALGGNRDRPNTASHQRAQALAKAALDGSDWTPEEKRAAAEAITEWLPKVVQVDIKDERKKLKLRQLSGAP